MSTFIDATYSEASNVLKCKRPVPDGSPLKVTVAKSGDVEHETWECPRGKVSSFKLSAKEKKWLEQQIEFANPNQYVFKKPQKGVEWKALGYKMFQESNSLGNPDDFRPLFHETLGFTWNANQWRFPWQGLNVFPHLFTKEENWTWWLAKPEGKQWAEAQTKVFNPKKPINFIEWRLTEAGKSWIASQDNQ